MGQFIPYFHMSWDNTTSFVTNIFLTAGILNIGLNFGGIIYQYVRKIMNRRRAKVIPKSENSCQSFNSIKEVDKPQDIIKTNQGAIEVENLEE
jgi:hypothetical protein